MAEQFTQKERLKVAVFMILTRQEDPEGSVEILLQRRKNTGYMDGKYDFSASGHLEKGESLRMTAIRESKEELGIEIELEAADFVFLADGCSDGYLKVFFTASVWEGEIRLAEPEKCEELRWFDMDNLPTEEMIPYLPDVLGMVQDGKYYCCGAF